MATDSPEVGTNGCLLGTVPPSPQLSLPFAPSVLHDSPLQTCSLEGQVPGAGLSPPLLMFPLRRLGICGCGSPEAGWRERSELIITMQVCVCACAPPHLQEPPGAAGYEDVCVAGRLGPPFLVGGGCQRQQGIAVDPKQDRVDHRYAGDGETHPFEEAQELQRHGVSWLGALGASSWPPPGLAQPPLAGNHS